MRSVTVQRAEAAPEVTAPATRCRACGGARVSFWRFARASDARLTECPTYRLEHCLDCGTAGLPDDAPGAAPRPLYESGTYRRPAPARGALVEPLRRVPPPGRVGVPPPPAE